MLFVLPYPVIDPVLVDLGPLPIRWYALAYVAGIVLGWFYMKRLCAADRLWGDVRHPTPLSIDDLVVYVALGIVLGGRLGYVLFYNPGYYLEHPLEIVAAWNGGMAFHGGLIGTVVGMAIFARRAGVRFLSVADGVAAVVPIGLFLGRIANFIKPELWGREAPDVPWAMVFPGAGPVPRHPSQLYEAGLEGIGLFVLLFVAIRLGALKRPGLSTGLFAAGYALARIASEFFRQPDPQLGFLFGGATMGMLLSLPLLAVGVALIAWALRPRRRAGRAGAPA
ncbi:prolipoprotein diacylglyceryl transferase [Lichenibacterium dinghuense]|uniref:prolipoprotein diacylglyceryl transferase n=1 Tax=Lichenibacterium dinghuense TaxID=2895977 RepID=UPI001F00EB84|nr:prolipoprotein diacylglyceryl transferase [Lichenibacterium sp. 6Y81]